MKKIYPATLLVFVLIFVLISPVQAQSPQETLTQYLSDLQKNPNDTALREKIIRHVQTMRPAPAIPEEARRNYVMAKTLFKDAKNVQDYNDALAKFKTALLIAPWWANAYLDSGLAYEAAQQYNEAINALKLFIVASPDSEKARKAQDEIYIIEAKKEKAAKESSPQAAAAKKRQTEEDFIKKLNGVRFVRNWSTNYSAGYSTMDIRGGKIIEGMVCSRGCAGEYSPGVWVHINEQTLNGREFSSMGNCMSGGNVVRRVFKGQISEDGYSITFEDCTGIIIYHRER
ncbi:MAG: hypothetical protein V1753_02885 [Pseudomonadota bacterium]